MQAYYEEIQVKLQRALEHVARYTADYDQVREFVVGLKRDETYLSFGYEKGDLSGIIVQFHLLPGESFKAAEPAINKLLELGWQPKGTKDDTDWGYRQYEFTKASEAGGLLSAYVRAWVGKDTVCRKVVTGSTEVYEFRCDG